MVSGDFKRRPDPTCPPFEPIPCDVFITEATFALPVFHHPSDMAEIGRLLRSVATFPERTHLVGVYALGKCQRVIRLLRAAGWDGRIWLHGALVALCKLYQEQGVELGDIAHVGDAVLETFKRRHRALPAVGHLRPLVATLRRSGAGGVLGLDAGARPRPPEWRRAAADRSPTMPTGPSSPRRSRTSARPRCG